MNKYLNRRKEREAKLAQSPEEEPTKFPRGSDSKLAKAKKQGAYTNAKYEQGDQLLEKKPAVNPHIPDAPGFQPSFALGCNSALVPPPRQEVLWQTEPYDPSDMWLNHQGGRTTIEGPHSTYQQPLHNLSYDRVAFNFNQQWDIYPGTTEDALCSTNPESNTRLSRSSVIQLAPSRLGRHEVGVLQEEERKNQEETEKSIQDNPVLPFTLEEEFKVVDFMVRIQEYLAKRFIFINNNFGDSYFTEKNFPEGPMYDLALHFHQLNIDHYFDEMKYLSRDVKMEMLKITFPANIAICVAMVKSNLQGWNFQPLALGCEKVGKLKLEDQETFTFPWAFDYADGVKFSQTVARVAEVLGMDMKLQALYYILVMFSPCQTQV